MKVSFELSDRDLRYFYDRLRKVQRGKSARAEHKVIAGARNLVVSVAEAKPPPFVTERIEKLQTMIDMLRDDDWRLEGRYRGRILNALAYFVDPDDIIPDRVPGLGYLDDAIMVELVVKELVHEIQAYQDFCTDRDKHGDREDLDEYLEKRRGALQDRMQRRIRRGESGGRSSRRRRPRAIPW